jgi:hypothetical protein
LRTLEDLAREIPMTASDFLSLRDEYVREWAASGEPFTLTRNEWMNRYQDLERRRFAAAEQQQRLL